MQYVVKGTRTEDPESETLFYQIDAQSGYPCTAFGRGKQTPDLMTAVSWLKECTPDGKYVKMHNAKVCALEYREIDIDYAVLTKQSMVKVIEKLTPEEKSVLKGLL